MTREFGDRVQVGLIAGTNGVFEIVGDGELLFSKRTLGRFPDPGEVAGLIRSKV